MLQETGIATLAQEMHLAAALRDKGVHPLLQQPTGGDGSHFHLERGGPPYRGQHQVRGGARGAQFHGNRPREGRGPGDPHGRGRPQPHQRPRAASRLLPVGGTGGVLGRHTNVCHGTQPRWETPGGHRQRHQHLHGCHHQPGHRALLRGLGGLRFPEGHGRRRGGHDPHAPPVPAQGDTFLVNEPLLPWSLRESVWARGMAHPQVKPVRTPVAILGSLGVCIYVPASRHWLISYSPIHLI